MENFFCILFGLLTCFRLGAQVIFRVIGYILQKQNYNVFGPNRFRENRCRQKWAKIAFSAILIAVTPFPPPLNLLFDRNKSSQFEENVFKMNSDKIFLINIYLEMIPQSFSLNLLSRRFCNRNFYFRLFFPPLKRSLSFLGN